MSAEAIAIVGAILGAIVGFVVLLALRVGDIRERLARVEQRVDDYLSNGRRRRRDQEEDE